MLSIDQDLKCSRNKKKRNYVQYTQCHNQFCKDSNLYGEQSNQFMNNNQFDVREKIKLFQSDMECEEIHYTPQILDQQSLKEFSTQNRQLDIEMPRHQKQEDDLVEEIHKSDEYKQKEQKNQIETHVQYLLNSNRIPIERAKVIKSSLYDYYNQMCNY